MAPTKKVPQMPSLNLGTLLDAGDRAIVILEAGETRLVAHRAVLAARSPVFEAMFSHDTVEASSGQVTITDLEAPVLRQLLAYCYTLRAPQVPRLAPQLLVAADKYGLLSLKAQCEQQMAKQLTVENAAATAVLAIRHSCSSLRQAAITFIKAHTPQVMATQGWADAVRTQPEVLVEMSRLLAETPAEARTAATAKGGPTPEGEPAKGGPTTDGGRGSILSIHHLPQGQGRTLGRGTTLSIHALPKGRGPTLGRGTTLSIHALPKGRGPTLGQGTTLSIHALPKGRGPTLGRGTTLSIHALPKGRGPTLGTHHLPQSSNCDHAHATAAPTTAPHHASSTYDASISHLRKLSVEERDSRLIEAAKQGVVEELRALLAAGADVSAKGLQGWTTLHWAAERGHVEVATFLLRAGAQVDAKNAGQETPLHVAALWGHAAVVQLLLAACADPNARDQRGRTPLHRAALWGHAEAATRLLEEGANRVAMDENEKTPLDIARQYSKHQLIEVLTKS